jgi:hypothetical protein
MHHAGFHFARAVGNHRDRWELHLLRNPHTTNAFHHDPAGNSSRWFPFRCDQGFLETTPRIASIIATA